MKLKYDEQDLKVNRILFFVFGLLIGFVLIGIVIDLFVLDGYKEDIKELGSSICEQKYGSIYYFYVDGVLFCKEKLESYDGLKVKIFNQNEDDLFLYNLSGYRYYTKN